MLENNEIVNSFVEYDVIFVGQLGAVVCNILINISSNSYKYLVINDSKIITEPSLLPLQSPIINIQKNCPKNTDFQSQKIYKIVPQQNSIILKNKKMYRYRFLVYTAEAEEWVNYAMIQNLKSALQTNYSFVYSNILKSQPNISTAEIILQRFQASKKLQIKRMSNLQTSNIKLNQQNKQQNSEPTPTQIPFVHSQNSINIVFYIPNPPHYGHDNLNILYKFDQFIQNFNKKFAILQQKTQKIKNKLRKNNTNAIQKQVTQINFLLLLQGEQIFPYCSDLDSYFKQKIQQKGIKIMKYHKILKIDYLRRKIIIISNGSSQKLNQNIKIFSQIQNKLTTTVGYDYLYIYLKQRTTNLLEISGINPFKNCKKTLRNIDYKNIYIFGADLFPTTHSFRAVNCQTHLISNNLINQLKSNIQTKTSQHKSNPSYNLIQYSGSTSFILWISQNNYIKIFHQYEVKKNHEQISTQQIKNNNKFKQNEKSCCCFPFLQIHCNRLLYSLQVRFFYNLKSYGPPFYFFMPELNYEHQNQLQCKK